MDEKGTTGTGPCLSYVRLRMALTFECGFFRGQQIRSLARGLLNNIFSSTMCSGQLYRP